MFWIFISNIHTPKSILNSAEWNGKHEMNKQARTQQNKVYVAHSDVAVFWECLHCGFLLTGLLCKFVGVSFGLFMIVIRIDNRKHTINYVYFKRVMHSFVVCLPCSSFFFFFLIMVGNSGTRKMCGSKHLHPFS